ncbi:MAG: EamA family transporter [Chloroflexota bacterium]
MPYLFILGMILLTVYGQMIIKWRVSTLGAMPDGFNEKVVYLLSFIFNPWIISSYAAAFVASLFWMGTVRQLPLSYAYPFTSLSFVLVLFLSAVIFHESITVPKIIGVILIIMGITVAIQG